MLDEAERAASDDDNEMIKVLDEAERAASDDDNEMIKVLDEAERAASDDDNEMIKVLDEAEHAAEKRAREERALQSRTRVVGRYVMLRLPWIAAAHARAVCRAWRATADEPGFRPQAKRLARLLADVNARDADLEHGQRCGFESAAEAARRQRAARPFNPWLRDVCAGVARADVSGGWSRLRAGWLDHLGAPPDVARAAATVKSLARALEVCPDASPWSAAAALALCCAGGIDGGGGVARAACALRRAIDDDGAGPARAHATVAELLSHLAAELLPLRARRAHADALRAGLRAFECLFDRVGARPPAAAAGRRALTAEQREIVATDLEPGELLVVTAYAGTGKTTTMEQYVRRRCGERRQFLTLYFNRSMADEMRERMDGAVGASVLTFDAFLKRRVERQLPPDALDFNTQGGVDARAVQRVCGIDDDARFRRTVIRHTKETLAYWLHNERTRLTFVPHKVEQWWAARKRNQPELVVPDFCELARELWRAMMSLRVGLDYAGVAKALMLRTMLTRGRCAADDVTWMRPAGRGAGSVRGRLGV